MKSTLELNSERVPPTGAIGGPGALNALGRPGIDPWDLFIRETIQNSWDAQDPFREGPVRFHLEARQLAPDQHAALLREVITSFPPDGHASHWSPLRESDEYCIVLSDHGTTGLGGPTRADQDDDGRMDFADFIWNVGQPPDKQRGGGTYGYGKGVLYRASLSATIVVYSRCKLGRHEESRLIAAALGMPFDHSERRRTIRYTGRHWWCLQESDRVLAPATGAQADRIALKLGLPRRAQGDTGTTIMVLAADLGEDPGSTMRQMAAAAAWHCWPKLIQTKARGPDMQVTVSFEGGAVAVPDPRSHPDLREFVAAYDDLARDGETSCDVFAIESRRPKRPLGQLALRRFVVPAVATSVAVARPFEGPSHHVALLRSPQLVVKYLAGPELSTPGAAWSGVFLADDSADRDFAASEPPSHDDWTPQGLADKSAKSAVTVALQRIKETAKDFVRPRTEDGDGESQPLGRLADALGSLLQSDAGTGTGMMPAPNAESVRTGKAKSRTPRPSVTVVRDELLMVKGAPARRIQFTTTGADGTSSTTVRPKLSVAINDGASVEQDRPAMAELPRLLGWEDPDGRSLFAEQVEIRSDDHAVWSLFVSMPPDVAVIVDLSGEHGT